MEAEGPPTWNLHLRRLCMSLPNKNKFINRTRLQFLAIMKWKRLDLLSYPKTLGLQKKYLKQWFFRLWTKAAQDYDPLKGETNEVSPIITPIHCLRQCAGLSAGRRESKESFGCLADWEDRFRVQEANMLEFIVQSPREGELNIYIRRSTEVSSWISGRILIYTYMKGMARESPEAELCL